MYFFLERVFIVFNIVPKGWKTPPHPQEQQQKNLLQARAFVYGIPDLQRAPHSFLLSAPKSGLEVPGSTL